MLHDFINSMNKQKTSIWVGNEQTKACFFSGEGQNDFWDGLAL